MNKINYKIIRGDTCGFCSGVKRAVLLAQKAAADGEVYTLGELIHNPVVIKHLKKLNIFPVDDIERLPEGGTVLIRSHGITVGQEREINKRGLKVIDAACPKVKRAHRICKDLSVEFSRVCIVGAADHPEVEGILSRARDNGIVISTVEDAASLEHKKDTGILAQTTFRKDMFFKIVSELVKKADIVKIYNTICEETLIRQRELKKLSSEADVLLVVGGKNSSNTKKLFEKATEATKAYHVEDSTEVDEAYLNNVKKIGIITGASTPIETVIDIENKIRKFLSKQ
ncbi:MAG: 4-hydroxy-3-methylbut-2-enyl diphosphate reductase [Elusimicrobiota bacterium]|nr:4-hydroxy-3-methylbut-2-enyl diphosphate reductase [Elusimicrobiota bacterium]